MRERIGDWIQTYTQKKFYPLDPKCEEIDIIDIAHALSNICRFNGHCSTFYSVAEHSVRMAYEVQRRFKSRSLEKFALLHDSEEAYICDLPSPIKRSLKHNEYYIIGENLRDKIFEKFGLPRGIPEEIFEVDDVLLYTEGRDLMGNIDDWHDALDTTPLKEKIVPWNSQTAENRFLGRFGVLFNI